MANKSQKNKSKAETLEKYPSEEGWLWYFEVCEIYGLKQVNKDRKTVDNRPLEIVGVKGFYRYRISGEAPEKKTEAEKVEKCEGCATEVSKNRKVIVSGATLCRKCSYAVTIGNDLEKKARLKL